MRPLPSPSQARIQAAPWPPSTARRLGVACPLHSLALQCYDMHLAHTDLTEEEDNMAHKFPNRRCLDVVLDELEKAGVPYQLERNRHTKVRFSLNGRNEMYVVAVSTSNFNAHRHARADIRRMLRQAAVEVRS